MYKYVISCNFCKTLMNKINKPKLKTKFDPVSPSANSLPQYQRAVQDGRTRHFLELLYPELWRFLGLRTSSPLVGVVTYCNTRSILVSAGVSTANNILPTTEIPFF